MDSHPTPETHPSAPPTQSKPRRKPLTRRRWTKKKVRGVALNPEKKAALAQRVTAFTQQRGKKLNHFFRRKRDINVEPMGFQDLSFWSDKFADALELDPAKAPDWPPGSNPNEGDLVLDSCIAFWATYSQEQDDLSDHEEEIPVKKGKRSDRKAETGKSKGQVGSRRKKSVKKVVEEDQEHKPSSSESPSP